MPWQGGATGRGVPVPIPRHVRRAVLLRDHGRCQLRLDGCRGVFAQLLRVDGAVANHGLDVVPLPDAEQVVSACTHCALLHLQARQEAAVAACRVLGM